MISQALLCNQSLGNLSRDDLLSSNLLSNLNDQQDRMILSEKGR